MSPSISAFGVSAAITPWNFPMLMPQQCILPSLVAGNTVIFKPSEETPLVGQAYADILNEFLPEGVLQTIHGADDQGKALVSSDINLVTFTYSAIFTSSNPGTRNGARSGRKIAKRAEKITSKKSPYEST